MIKNTDYSISALLRALPTAAAAAVLFTAMPLHAHYHEHPDFSSHFCRGKKVLKPEIPNNEMMDERTEEQHRESEKCSKWQKWKQKDFIRKPIRTKSSTPLPVMEPETSPAFPPPSTGQVLERIGSWLLSAIAKPAYAQATTNPIYDNIIIDGDLSDWSANDRLNFPRNAPPYLAAGDELYGKYVATPSPTYIIAIRSNDTVIGPNTTLWLNTDRNANTGYQIWGGYGGAEYTVNIYGDSTPHIYDQNFNWIQGPLIHAYSVDQSILEIAIPAEALPALIPPQAIDILGDINDAVLLFPEDLATGGQYRISVTPNALPPRTDFSKRVGIVFSETSKNLFYNEKAYSQLYMSVQHQAMMAGIPFDLISENELTDIANIVNYDALIFPFFGYVPSAIQDAVHNTLYKAIYDYGIGIITADNWMTNDQAGTQLSGDSYRYMKQLLGISRVDGQGPVELALTAGNADHPAIEGYTNNEHIFHYDQNWYSYYDGVPGQPVTTLAYQTVTGSKPGTYPAMLASETGGRNVHFANFETMGDTNLLWSALQWVVYGNETAVGLKLGRNQSLFIARNDMDQALFNHQIPVVHVPLLNLLEDWKNQYNFVGSYYITLGNDPAVGLGTDWNVSAPLFRDYINLGNEIGTHSLSHPYHTDSLNAVEIELEFNQSMNEILAQLGSTWRNQQIRGGAVPGMPESIATAQEISQYLDYLSGGYSGIGAGYPSAFGYSTPDSTKPYFSPNMYFDFTLIEFGVPTGNPPVPVPLTAAEAETFWQDQYAGLKAHASQPIIHWPWHDYAATVEADPVTGSGYTVDMFENTIATAFMDNTEFVTTADVAQRIGSFKDARFDVSQYGPVIETIVEGSDLGKFSVLVEGPPEQVITQVENWYAYGKDRVFLDDDGGTFVIQLGTSVDPISHITALPMRAKLLSLNGDGTNLQFSFEGEGEVVIALSSMPSDFNILGADSVSERSGNEIGLNFQSFGTHNVIIIRKSANNTLPVANDQSVATDEDTQVAITLSASDADNDPVIFTILSQPTFGLLSGTGPNITYIPFMDANGSDSFTFNVNDGNDVSNLATVNLTINPVDDPPSFSVNPITMADAAINTAYSGTIAGTATEVDGDSLTYRKVNGPTWLSIAADGTLSGTPSLSDLGTNTWTVEVTDGNNTAQTTLAINTTATDVNTPAMLVRLPLDEGSGVVAGDMSGKGNNGTLRNGAEFDASTPDGSSYAVRFDGVDDSIDLGSLDVNGNGLSLTTWFNADSFPGAYRDERLISKASGTAENDHIFMLSTIRVGSATRLRARVRVGGVTTTLIANSGNVQTGAWYHAALTYDQAMLRLYLNGTEVGSRPLTGAVDVDPALSVSVGSQPSGAGGKAFDGLLDDVRILQRALTENEIAAIYVGVPSTQLDSEPPTPNQANWASVPTAINNRAISMTATTGSDASGPVEYYFTETSLNPGGTDSGWQTSSSYTDMGLNPGTQYTYTVKMRDALLNIGEASTPASATTTSDLSPAVLVELPLDEGNGVVAGDISGLGNNGTLLNGAAFEANTPDSSPYAVRFDGADDSIDLGSLDVVGNGLSLTAWFNANSFPGSSRDPRLISKASGTAANDHVFMLSTIRAGAATRLRARLRIGGVTTTLIANDGDLVPGVWQHAALTYDGTMLRLYLDGVEVGSTPLSGLVDMDPELSVAIGSQPSGAGGKAFDGLLDDVRILQRALSATEVAAISASVSSGGN